jgi:hypothetical protein
MPSEGGRGAAMVVEDSDEKVKFGRYKIGSHPSVICPCLHCGIASFSLA